MKAKIGAMGGPEKGPDHEAIRQKELQLHRDLERLAEVLDEINRIEDYDLGKAASDALYAYFQEDIQGFYSPLDAFGAEVRKSFGEGGMGRTLAWALVRNGSIPTQGIATGVMLLLGTHMFCMELVEALTDEDVNPPG
jgi:hypothetical protein